MPTPIFKKIHVLFVDLALGSARLWTSYLAVLTLTAVSTCTSVSSPAQTERNALASDMFFDAAKSRFRRNGLQQEFEGDVVALGIGTMITADRIVLDRETGKMHAAGEVIVVSQSEIFSGSQLDYYQDSGDFRIQDARIVTKSPLEARKFIESVLGFTTEELAFEVARNKQLESVQNSKRSLLSKYRQHAEKGGELTKDYVENYAILLERERLIAGQENPRLAVWTQKQRERIKRRRKYWQAVQKQSGTVATGITMYLRLEGKEIVRTNGNDFIAQEAMFSPCKCEEGESPAWGFRADEVILQPGGYADLYQAVLEIRGLPVIYFPYLKIPIKSKRQSGFLFPTFRFQPKGGNVYRQPIYLNLAKNADATLTADIYEKRGTRLGLELRYQQRNYSGWEFHVETLRDQVWLSEGRTRREYAGILKQGLDRAAAGNEGTAEDLRDQGLEGKTYTRERVAQKSYWDQIGDSEAGACINGDEASCDAAKEKIDQQLDVPSNSWRGSYRWRGLTFFAPRLSLVSEGSINSDHRYEDELYLPSDANPDALLANASPPAFSRAKAKVHLDGADFYVGAGTFYGDTLGLKERFEGLQMPAQFSSQTRLFTLGLEEVFPLWVYNQVAWEYYRFERLRSTPPESEGFILGEGQWQRVRWDITAPLSSDGIVTVDTFAKFETRDISHPNLLSDHSSISSWRTGISFKSLLDGKIKISEQEKDSQDDFSIDRYLQHIMDWRITFSTRPSVIRHGPYGDPFQGEQGSQTFFVSDRQAFDTDRVPEVDTMNKHNRIIFSTNHSWRIYETGWSLLPAVPPKSSDKDKRNTKEQAKKELHYATDRPVQDVDQVFDGNTWLINRYKYNPPEKFETPITFSSSISFDFNQEQQRKKDREEGKEELTEAWSPLSSTLGLNWSGWALSNSMQYNIYKKKAQKLSFNLSLPRVLSTSLGFSYVIEKTDDSDSDNETKTRIATLSSELIPYLKLVAEGGRKNIDEQPETYRANIGFVYSGPSECWQLTVVRKKDFDKTESSATYIAQLSIVFAGQQRAFPNLARPALRESGENVDDAGFP